MAPGEENLAFVDSLFTATSAVCVTGLIVRDTATEFTFFGQALILALIQLGGLGILTFTNLVILARRGRVGLSGRILLQQSHGLLPNIPPHRLLRDLLFFTFAFESLGAALLALRFWISYDFGFFRSCWLGVFHSVSAFCNAGFGLFTNSLVDFRSDVFINGIVMILIVTGGIGFVVFVEARNYLEGLSRRRRVRLSLHTRVVLGTTLLLILAGWGSILLLELTGQGMSGSFWNNCLESLFLSVTSRTAGFNTVDMNQLSNATLLIVILLMFVGGSPGSAAGGVKTTTLATLVGVLFSRARNRPHIELLDRTLPQEVVAKAFMNAAGFLLTCFIAVVALQITELYGQPHALRRGQFLEFLFEVVSALGTVGLSTGITGALSTAGKTVIIVCMFFGRLGPVLVASSLIGRQRRIEYSYPTEEVIVG
jgi:trk system potassium uptake protein TrkH